MRSVAMIGGAVLFAVGGLAFAGLIPVAAWQGWQTLLVLLTVLCGIGAFLFTLADEALSHASQPKLLAIVPEDRRPGLANALETSAQYRLLCRIGQFVMLLGLLLGIAGLSVGLATFTNADARLVPALTFVDLVVAMAIVVAVHLLLNKVVAGHLGMTRAESIVARSLPVLRVLRFPLLPLVALVGLGRRQATRLFGEPQPESADLERELIHLAERAEGSGLLDRNEMAMLQKLIDFKDAVVEEVMTPRTEMFAVEVETTLPEAMRIAHESGYTRLPVYEKNHDHVIGIFNTRDLLPLFSRLAEERADVAGELPSLREIMHEPFFVPEGKDVGDLLNEMTRGKISMAVVIDEYSGTAGIVTIEDIIEEIVGEIVDEYDFFEPSEEDRIVEVEPDVYDVDARMPVDDFNDRLGLSLPEEEDFETVGGFLFFAFGSIPRKGDAIETHGARFEITDSEARRIKRVRVQRLLRDGTGDDSERIAAQTAAGNGNGWRRSSSRRLSAAGTDPGAGQSTSSGT